MIAPAWVEAQATCRLRPVHTTGTPGRVAPATSRPPPRRHRPVRRAVMAAIEEGTRDWWAWAERNGLDVRTCESEPPNTQKGRTDAYTAGLRDDNGIVSKGGSGTGWNVTTRIPGTGASKCYFHTDYPTRYTRKLRDLRVKLNRDAPKRKSSNQGFTNTKDLKRERKRKLRDAHLRAVERGGGLGSD